VVSYRAGDPAPDIATIERRVSLPFVVITVAHGEVGQAWQDLSDVVLDESDHSVDDIVSTVTTRPLASTTLALLLRSSSRHTVPEGLVAESAAYSVLQAGPEFAAWRTSRAPRPPEGTDARVLVVRAGNTLVVTLARPERLNALDARMRDELLDALRVAMADPTITRIELRGEGRAFCAGGDLDEFGSRSDPATAHVIRLRHSVGRVLDELRARTSAHIHGPCVGSGIELAAFAGAVHARSDTAISLPEINLGLIPGAGGTVSLPRRIGRLRTAWLALSGATIDAATALAWGLVDVVDDVPGSAEGA
jgi:enoyl-CoA hydratase/carnithine racemase